MRQRVGLLLIRRRATIRRALAIAVGALGFALAGNSAGAQGGAAVPWTVEIRPTLNPLPIGACGTVWVTFTDPTTRDRARNAVGEYVSIADVDLALDAAGGTAVGQYNGPRNWSACACQSASVGSQVTVTATYPAKALPDRVRVKGMAVQSKASFAIGRAQGTFNPTGCGVIPPKVATTGATTTTGTAITTATVPEPSGRVAVVPAVTPVVTAAGGGTPASLPPLVPVNPAGFIAVQSGPGQVLLAWQPVSAASYYVVLGPGSANGGVKVSGATTFAATAVPQGSQEFAVASFYEPGPTSTPAAQFSRATVNVTVPGVAVTAPAPQSGAVAAVSGRYLVTMVALRAYQASVDDILSRDGVGDEVYAAAFVRRYDRSTGNVLESIGLRSMTYGDVTNFGTQRVQAGSRSGTGGIQDGDPVPVGPLIAMRSAPAQSATFPLRLWEGALTDGVDALVITPSIWEEDVGKSLYVLWEQEQQTLTMSLFTSTSVQDQISQKRFGVLVSGASGIGGGTGLGSQLRMAGDFAMVNLGLPIVSLLSTSEDRPIGLVANGADQAKLATHAVVLTREIIEAALASPALGFIPSPVLASPASLARIGTIVPKAGVIMIQFEDSQIPGILAIPERPAIYQMFIQVERLP